MRKYLLFLLMLFAAQASHALSEDDLLEAKDAFRLSVKAVDADTVEARWQIAQGYYMYRDKFRFEVVSGDATIGDPNLPPGVRKHDEFFGDVETYRGELRVSLPIKRGGGAAQKLELRITGQGCADVGVCYPPDTRQVSLTLPAAAATTQKRERVADLKQLGDLVAPQSGQEFLQADEAFRLALTPAGADAVRARIDIAKGYYLYRDKTRFRSADSAVRVGSYELPKGKVKEDPYFGKQQVYYEGFETTLPLTRDGSARTFTLIAEYQGCAEKGICYPPVTKKISLTLPAGPASVGTDGAAAATADTGPGAAAREEAARATSAPGMLAAVVAAFGIGLLLTFTPCVLPMIPILSSVIVGSAKNRNLSKFEGGMLSGAYVLGTAVTYTIAGAIAGATGGQLQAYFQNAWAIGFFAALFVLLALSMFGFYELQMPSFIQSHLHQHSERVHSRFRHLKGGAFFGLFGMGLLSALIVGACVSPLLISALSVAISSRDPVLGGAIMFSMALGMGVVLIAIGVGAGFLMPKAGPWMNTVKHVFGVLLIAVAIYILGALPQVPVLLLWALLLIIVAVYLGATQSLSKEVSGWAYLWKGVGTIALIWGVLALLGGFAGNRDILNPLNLGSGGVALNATASSPAGPAKAASFQRVTSVAELDQALARAKAEGRPVMVDYYADWCTDCHRLERSTFSDARVQQQFQRFALIKADVTDNNDATRALKQRFSVLGPPAMVFIGANGEVRRELQFYGYKSPDEFLGVLQRI